MSANCRRGRPQLAARGRNLKKNTFPTKPLFFKMLPCHSSGHSSGCFTRNGHLRPLAAHTPVAIRSHSSGRKWPLHRQRPLAANCSQPLRPFAATRSHLSGSKWPQVATSPITASCSQVQPTPVAIRSHLQPLEWPQVAASPTTVLQPSAANPCGHSQPLE